MAQNQKSYDNEFKAQAVKLAPEIGGYKAAMGLGVPKGTMYTWIKVFKEGRLSANEAVHTPKNAISYWNNRQIGSANGGLPPMVKRQRYYASIQKAA